MTRLAPYLLVGCVAAGLTYLLTPPVIALCRRVGALAWPGDRKVHTIATPTLGGLAMWMGFLGALLIATRLEAFDGLFALPSGAVGVAIGASLMTLIGLVDDLKGLTAPAKLAAQIFAAAVMTGFGAQVISFWLPGPGTIGLSPDLAVVLTVVIVIVTVNAVNLVDGLDGLAAGLVAIAAAAYFVFSFRNSTNGLFSGATPAPLLAAATAGVCLGFLPHNFNPAKVFMGDTGAMLLGTLLAGATITGIGHTTRPLLRDGFALVIPVAIPLLVLALPFLDTTFAVLRRMRSRRGVMVADKAHLHHRLLEIGHSHRKTVLLLWLWAALPAGATIALSIIGSRQVIPVFVLVALTSAVLLVAQNRRTANKPS
jgi:UDP-GlcNAc:undecaprenyl-phosphate/decaprenyl-phosphate GlcNAc-1-phosphate transferase